MVEGGAAERFDDAEQAHWRYLSAIGIEYTEIRALTARLEADFRAADGGFASLGALPPLQRAIASDQILGAVQALLTNLAEARVHEQDANALLADGEAVGEPTLASRERDTRKAIAFVGFFRAIGSALDNAAALSIGVLRIPRSIRRATFSWILRLPDELADELPRWLELRELVQAQGNEPQGWLDWTLEMRHALMHRPRHMSFALPRPTPPLPIWLPGPVAQRWVRERARFDAHFRRRPWLPDLQHLADSQLGQLFDVVLSETAVQTTRGVFLHTNQLLEQLSAFLAACWEDEVVIAIPPPADNWALEQAPQIEFDGFAPVPFPNDLAAAVISVRDQERMALAAQLHNRGQL
jgi:hypothetical protein